MDCILYNITINNINNYYLITKENFNKLNFIILKKAKLKNTIEKYAKNNNINIIQEF